MTKEDSIKEVSRHILKLMTAGHLKLDLIPISNRYSLLTTETEEIIGIARTDSIRREVSDYVLIGDYINVVHNDRTIIGMIDYIVSEKTDCRVHIIGINTDDERDKSFFAKPNQLKRRSAPHYYCKYTRIELSANGK